MLAVALLLGPGCAPTRPRDATPCTDTVCRHLAADDPALDRCLMRCARRPGP